MTLEMYAHCEKELADAHESGDADRIRAAEIRILVEVMKCQHKTRTTQKAMHSELIGIRQDMNLIKQDLPELKKSHAEFQRMKIEANGARKLIVVLSHLAASGVGALLLKWLQGGAAQ